MIACRDNSLNIANLLIDKGADINIRYKGMTALKASCINKESIPCLRLLLNKGASPDEIVDEENEKTILHIACEKENYEAIKQLLKYGAFIDPRTKGTWNEDKRRIENAYLTPLHISCIKGDFRAANYLLYNGADINASSISNNINIY